MIANRKRLREAKVRETSSHGGDVLETEKWSQAEHQHTLPGRGWMTIGTLMRKESVWIWYGPLFATILKTTILASAIDPNQSAIQDFFRKPPIITNLEFSVTRNPSFPTRNSAQTWTNNYSARIQDGEVFLQGIADFAEAQRPFDAGWPERVILASSSKGSWTLCNGALFEIEGMSLRQFWAEEKTALLREKSAFNDLQAMLNLGIKEVPIGAVEWKGDRFEFTNANGIYVTGSLTATNGVVTALDLLHEFHGEKFRYQVRYEYNDERALPFLPSKITRVLLQRSGEVLDSEFLIRECKVSETPLPQSAYSYGRFAKFVKGTFTVRRGELLVKSVAKWQPVSTARQVYHSKWALYTQPALFCAFVICSTVALMLWWKEKSKPS